LSAGQPALQFQGHHRRPVQSRRKGAKNYDEVGTWLLANGTAKTPPEIEDWSDDQEGGSPMKDPEKRDLLY
jgi:hypothetical protein